MITTVLIVIVVIIAVLLMLVVLAQNSKGGGFASNFSASNQLIGVKKTGDLLEKLTWTFAILVLTLSLVINLVIETPTADAQGSPNMRTTESPVAPTIGGQDEDINLGQEMPGQNQTDTATAQ